MFPASTLILVVEDMDVMRDHLIAHLKQLGYTNIMEANSGDAALESLMTATREGQSVRLILSDWNMPGMTGYDLLREVRADPNLATTPFIMITAESKTENVIAAKKAGVNNYIVKPFNAATLKTKIEAVFPDMASA